MIKFIIFAGARTGSTSLANVLGASKDVKMAIEPFHPNYSKWNPKKKNYSTFIKDAKTMNQALDELFEKFTAIKVLDYQFSEKIYFSMLARKDIKILFLRRRNILESSISSFVAHQTSNWHKTKDLSIYNKLKPINLKKLEEMIDYVAEMNNKYLAFLEKNRKSEFLPLFYEELYSENLKKNKKTLQKICKFVEIALPKDSEIKKYMTPSISKINYENIYSKIPNYQEILNKFAKT